MTLDPGPRSQTTSSSPTPGNPPARPHPWRGRIFLLVRLGVAACLLVYLQGHIGGVGPVLAAMRSARLDLVIAAYGLFLLAHVLAANRLRAIIAAQGEHATTGELLAINLATIFYGMFLPGGGITGFAIRFHRLTESSRKFTAMVVALACDRLLAFVMLCVFGIVAWTFERPAGTVPVLVVMCAALLASLLVTLSLFSGVAARLVFVVAGMLPGGAARWTRLVNTLSAYRAVPGAALRQLVLAAVGAQLLGYTAYYLLARSLALPLSFAAVGWTRTAVGLVTTIPISISGLGVREGTLVALLGARGIAAHEAIAYSLLVFAVLIVGVAALGGVIEGVVWVRTRR